MTDLLEIRRALGNSEFELESNKGLVTILETTRADALKELLSLKEEYRAFGQAETSVNQGAYFGTLEERIREQEELIKDIDKQLPFARNQVRKYKLEHKMNGDLLAEAEHDTRIKYLLSANTAAIVAATAMFSFFNFGDFVYALPIMFLVGTVGTCKLWGAAMFDSIMKYKSAKGGTLLNDNLPSSDKLLSISTLINLSILLAILSFSIFSPLVPIADCFRLFG